MENCPLDKLPPHPRSERAIMEICEKCMAENEHCVFNGIEDVPMSFDEAYVKCLNCKDMATLWLENGDVEKVIQEHSKPSTRRGVKRERTFEPAGRYYSKDGDIWHRPCGDKGLCELIHIQKGERL